MKLHHEHPWDLTTAEARELQERLRPLASRTDDLGEIKTVAGVDCGVLRATRQVRAAVVVLDAQSLLEVDRAVTVQPVSFPYVPGFLSFREIPAILTAMEQLPELPDMVVCDGQGYAHPRRFGLACHLGVLLDRPSIGVAKSRFIGTHGDVLQQRGSRVPLMDKEEEIGAVLRTRDGVQPLYISCGHRIGLDTAIAWVLHLAPRYRLPETTRRADAVASARGWA
ncbi:MAG: deoxyribonuclease V [Gammaproteobacteria bacterium]|nr:deoxyribonuclease V [Gammaproteobacteria bacterium]